jgi:ATP-dependent Zn protease
MKTPKTPQTLVIGHPRGAKVPPMWFRDRMSTDDPRRGVPFALPDGDDEEMTGLIASWRYRGPSIAWDAIVGHGPQIQRCRELVEKLSRSSEELARLRIRAGAGLVISGPSGVGKSLMARALASALGREVIVPPTSELSAETIRRLYGQLQKDARAVVVLLDEAESLIGPTWTAGLDPAAQRSLLAALDGIERPDLGPITVALTTSDLNSLDEAATRPGRLAPRLVLEAPTAEEREMMLVRAITGLPGGDELNIATLVERTAGWTGAELVGAVEEACSRSLVDHSDSIREDLLLDVIAERYVVRDEHEQDDRSSLRVAIHEAGHVLYAYLNFPGGVRSVQLRSNAGHTSLDERIEQRIESGTGLYKLAELQLAGDAAESIYFGFAGRSLGSMRDKAQATSLFWQVLQTRKPYSAEVVEAGEGMGDRGSERMRASWHAELEALAHEANGNVLRWLTPHSAGLQHLARRILDAPDQTLSGEALEAAIEESMPGAVSDLYGEATDQTSATDAGDTR